MGLHDLADEMKTQPATVTVPTLTVERIKNSLTSFSRDTWPLIHHVDFAVPA